MDVGVRHLEPLDVNTDANGLQHLLYPPRYSLHCRHYSLVIFVIEIPQQVDLPLRDYQRVARPDRVNVEKRQSSIILVNLEAGDFTLDNFRKNRLRHSLILAKLSDFPLALERQLEYKLFMVHKKVGFFERRNLEKAGELSSELHSGNYRKVQHGGAIINVFIKEDSSKFPLLSVSIGQIISGAVITDDIRVGARPAGELPVVQSTHFNSASGEIFGDVPSRYDSAARDGSIITLRAGVRALQLAQAIQDSHDTMVTEASLATPLSSRLPRPFIAPTVAPGQ